MSKQILLLLTSFLFGYLTATIFDINSLSTWLTNHLTATHSHEVPVKPVAKTTPAPKPKFEFYTLLSKENPKMVHHNSPPQPAHVPQKVDPAPAAPAIAQENSVNKSKQTYLIQVAAFSKREDAEKLRASLVLHGFDVSVSAINQNANIWHRVMIGPFASYMDAERAQINVAQSDHIKGIIRKM